MSLIQKFYHSFMYKAVHNADEVPDVEAWRKIIFGLPVTISRCSNNYGPYHFPEKLIPLMIANALADKPLPVYGTGENVRDWLYVTDHCKAIDPTKIHTELGWLPETKFADGIRKTIRWYLDNRPWWEEIISGEYRHYYEKMYGNREQIKP